MEKEQKISLFRLTEGGEHALVARGNKEFLMHIVAGNAREYNCGVFRRWKDGEYYYYDCGPDTFLCEEKLDDLV